MKCNANILCTINCHFKSIIDSININKIFSSAVQFKATQTMATTKVLLSFPWSKGKDGDVSQLKEKVNVSDSVLKVAKKELREDKTTREQALEQMKDWLKKNFDVENVRSDDAFLLRFLRNKKFSVPMAQQQLLKYLNMRKVMGHLIFNLDFLSPGVRDLFNHGYIMLSPIRDKYGRRTVLYFASKIKQLIDYLEMAKTSIYKTFHYFLFL